MRSSILLLSVLIGGIASASADPLDYAICVSTLEHAELRHDSTWTTAAEARSRQAAILTDGWVIAGDSGRHKDTYPRHAILKVRFIDLNLDGGGKAPCGVPEPAGP